MGSSVWECRSNCGLVRPKYLGAVGYWYPKRKHVLGCRVHIQPKGTVYLAHFHLHWDVYLYWWEEQWLQSGLDDRQKHIHPAVKKLIGKEPRNWKPLKQRSSKYRPVVTACEEEPSVSKEISSTKESEKKERVSKVPRYIPPKSSANANSITLTSPLRGMHHKVKKRWDIVIYLLQRYGKILWLNE